MNTIINREALKVRLIQEGYEKQPGFEQTLDRLMSFTGQPARMLETWMESNRIFEFEPIEGISLSFLKKSLKMKDPAIIIAYAMLLDSPKINSVHLKRLANQKVIYKTKQ